MVIQVDCINCEEIYQNPIAPFIYNSHACAGYVDEKGRLWTEDCFPFYGISIAFDRENTWQVR
jgi:hypothetical protein